MKPLKAAKVSGVAGEAAFSLMQGLSSLLIQKGVISPAEWSAVVANAAIHHKTSPKMTEVQRLAGDFLAAYALALAPEEGTGRG